MTDIGVTLDLQDNVSDELIAIRKELDRAARQHR